MFDDVVIADRRLESLDQHVGAAHLVVGFDVYPLYQVAHYAFARLLAPRVEFFVTFVYLVARIDILVLVRRDGVLVLRPWRGRLARAVEAAGFAVEEVSDHREAMMTMRDDVASRVDYERLLPILGERGRAVLDGIETLETAVEEGRRSYVSLVASRDK